MTRQAKEIARRLRFHLFPRPDRFRRLYWLAGLIFIGAAVAAWLGLGATLGARQYMPAPKANRRRPSNARNHVRLATDGPHSATDMRCPPRSGSRGRERVRVGGALCIAALRSESPLESKTAMYA